MPPDRSDAVAPIVRRKTQVLFKVSEEEKKKYVKAAAKAGKNLSKWIRLQLDAASEQAE